MRGEELKTDHLMDWLAPDPEFREFVRAKLKDVALMVVP